MDHVLKRTLSFLLTLVMVLSLVPAFGHVHAHAEETEQEPAASVTPTESETPAGSEVNQYTIIFVNYDGTILETVVVNEGEVPVYSGEEPVQPADDTYVYKFAGWDVDRDFEYNPEVDILPPATEDTFYIAQYYSALGYGIATIANHELTCSAVADLGITYSDGTNSGTATWTPGANTINGSVVGKYSSYTVMNKGYHQYDNSATTLTLTNNKTTKAKLTFKYEVTNADSGNTVNVNGAVIKTETTGSVDVDLEKGESITVVLNAKKKSQLGSDPGPNGSSIRIYDLALTVLSDTTVTFGAAQNGTYTVTDVATGAAVNTSTPLKTLSTTKYNLTATPAEGYVFSGWYYTKNGVETFFCGVQNATERIFDGSGTLVPKFIPAENGIWAIGEAMFVDLNTALTAADSGAEKVVVLLKDLSLSDTYTIPLGVTVLIPYDDAGTSYGPEPYVEAIPDGVNADTYTPSVFRKLTMTSGAKFIVNGCIEVGAKHYAAHGGNTIGGRPVDKYGLIVMEGDSSIVLNAGGKLFAWGYITGSGTVTAESGSQVYEKMQIADYRGGGITSVIVCCGVFPFNQYYIQNVEVKEILKAGSSLIAHAGLYANAVETSTLDFMASSGAMFNLSSGNVTKYYDASSDRLVLDIEGKVSMNSVTVMDEDTSNFILPLNHNITINFKRGSEGTLAQDVMMLPGATIKVDSGASLTIAEGKKLYSIDASDWGAYCFGQKLVPISFTPTHGGAPGKRTADNMSDAQLNINGSLVVNGRLYATNTGAQIVSSEGTGTVGLNAATSGTATIYQSHVIAAQIHIHVYADPSDNSNLTSFTLSPAVLTDGEDGPISIAGKTGTYSYCKNCNYWIEGLASAHPCFTVTFDGNGATSGSMASVESPASYTLPECGFTKEGHDFVGWNVNGASKLPGETITLTDNTVVKAEWVAKTFDIVWKNGDTVIYTDADVAYGTEIRYNHAEPAKDYDEDKHYTFAGWSLTDGGEAVDFGTVTGDVTYYAVFLPEDHVFAEGKCTCGAEEPANDVTVVPKGTIKHTVSGQVVTVTHNTPCKVGYLDAASGKYIAIAAKPNTDGSYNFEVPKGVTEVLLVVKGDVNGSGGVNAGDRVALSKSLLGKTHANYAALSEAWQIFAADVNNSNSVNAGDRVALSKSLLGKTHANYQALTW